MANAVVLAGLANGCGGTQPADKAAVVGSDRPAVAAAEPAWRARALALRCDRPSLSDPPIQGHVAIFTRITAPGPLRDCLIPVLQADRATRALHATQANARCGDALERFVRETVRHTSACAQTPLDDAHAPFAEAPLALARVLAMRARELADADQALDLLLTGVEFAADVGRASHLVDFTQAIIAQRILLSEALDRINHATPARLPALAPRLARILVGQPSLRDAVLGEGLVPDADTLGPDTSADNRRLRAQIQAELVRLTDAFCGADDSLAACARQFHDAQQLAAAVDGKDPAAHVTAGAFAFHLEDYVALLGTTHAVLHTLAAAVEVRRRNVCPSVDGLAGDAWRAWLDPVGRGSAASASAGRFALTLTWPSLLAGKPRPPTVLAVRCNPAEHLELAPVAGTFDETAPARIIAMDAPVDVLLDAVGDLPPMLDLVPNRLLTGRISASRAADLARPLLQTSGFVPRKPVLRGGGRKVNLSFSRAPAHDLFRVLADVRGRSNVRGPEALPTLAIHVQNAPADALLTAVAARYGLTVKPGQGIDYLVPQGAALPALLNVNPGRVTVTSLDATLADVVAALEAALGQPLPIAFDCHAAGRLSLQLKHVPVAEAVRALSIASGQAVTTGQHTCHVPALSNPDFANSQRLTAIASAGTNAGATLVGANGAGTLTRAAPGLEAIEFSTSGLHVTINDQARSLMLVDAPPSDERWTAGPGLRVAALRWHAKPRYPRAPLAALLHDAINDRWAWVSDLDHAAPADSTVPYLRVFDDRVEIDGERVPLRGLNVAP